MTDPNDYPQHIPQTVRDTCNAIISRLNVWKDSKFAVSGDGRLSAMQGIMDRTVTHRTSTGLLAPDVPYAFVLMQGAGRIKLGVLGVVDGKWKPIIDPTFDPGSVPG